MLQQAYSILYGIVLASLAIAALLALIRSIMANNLINRFIGINILTMVVLVSMCVLSVFLNEGYITDIALVYALLSFIAVLLLCRVYINLFKKDEGGKK